MVHGAGDTCIVHWPNNCYLVKNVKSKKYKACGWILSYRSDNKEFPIRLFADAYSLPDPQSISVKCYFFIICSQCESIFMTFAISRNSAFDTFQALRRYVLRSTARSIAPHSNCKNAQASNTSTYVLNCIRLNLLWRVIHTSAIDSRCHTSDWWWHSVCLLQKWNDILIYGMPEHGQRSHLRRDDRIIGQLPDLVRPQLWIRIIDWWPPLNSRCTVLLRIIFYYWCWYWSHPTLSLIEQTNSMAQFTSKIRSNLLPIVASRQSPVATKPAI